MESFICHYLKYLLRFSANGFRILTLDVTWVFYDGLVAFHVNDEPGVATNLPFVEGSDTNRDFDILFFFSHCKFLLKSKLVFRKLAG